MLELKVEPAKFEIFSLGDITEKRQSTPFAPFRKIAPAIKEETKHEVIIL